MNICRSTIILAAPFGVCSLKTINRNDAWGSNGKPERDSIIEGSGKMVWNKDNQDIGSVAFAYNFSNRADCWVNIQHFSVR